MPQEIPFIEVVLYKNYKNEHSESQSLVFIEFSVIFVISNQIINLLWKNDCY